MQESGRNSSVIVALQFGTIAAILAAIVINALSNFFPLRGLSIGAVANTILGGVRITPANYAFAIWGVIYLGLIGFGIYQALPSQRFNSHLLKLRAPIIWASLFQIVWVYAFQLQQFWLSVALMFGILINLIAAYLWSRFPNSRVPREEKWLAQVPISIYLGWISVASIVNVASALYASGWTGAGIDGTISTVIMILIAAAITAAIVIRYRDVAFTGVIIWALLAIAVRQFAQFAISVTAIGSAIALVLLFFSRNRSRGT
ncbi:tryptophan-rich sensory protein [Cyanobacteria bacterium FACHB-DQ100]|nr:tryptophan-rich sensory protein [Cyanobacteria bacterium FACHB-DQ100]